MQYPTFSAGIAVKDAGKAIGFYQQAFGARERLRLVDPETGGIGHAEILIKNGLLMISDEYPAFNKSPETLGGTTVKLCLMADDVDKEYDRAIAAGATSIRAPSDQFYGHRSACFRDPFGHEWTLSKEIKAMTQEEMQEIWNGMVASGKTGEDQKG